MKKFVVLLLSVICVCGATFCISACEKSPDDGGLSQIVQITDLTLDVSSMNLQVGESGTLIATVKPENATDKTVTWQSLDPNVATVENGKVTAVGEGVTSVFAVCGLKNASCIITVTDEPKTEVTSITLSEQALNMQIGENRMLIATVKPENATDKTVTWQSLDSKVATVENGKVSAVGEGDTTVLAVCGSKTASCIVTVSKKPIEDIDYGITFDKTSLLIHIGESAIINATVNIGGVDKTLIWQSTDKEVVTVKDGKLEALKAGMAIIVATCGDYSASCVVSVIPVETTGVTLDKTSLSLYIGDNTELKANVSPDNATNKTILWQSLDSSIARVVDGKVYGVSEGSTVITAMCTSATEVFTATCVVKVIDGAVTGLVFDKKEHSMFIGETFTVAAKVLPEYAKDKTIIWSSSDENIATVEDGVVTALSDGEITITGSAGGFEAVCKIKIEDPNPVVKIEVIGEENAFIDEFSLSDYHMKATRRNGVTENIAIDEEYISVEDFEKLSSVGAHTITVTYKKIPSQWVITIVNHDFEGVEFESQTFVYDGSAKSLKVTGAPEGTEITYENNGQTDLGEYIVTATLTKQYYNTKTLTATLTIKFNSFDEAEFKSQTFLYDGEEKSLIVTGVPEGTYIEYTNNAQTEVGEYIVTAELRKTFYYTKTLTATLKIELREHNVTYVLCYDNVTNDNPVKFNVALGLKLLSPVRVVDDGKYFSGWYTDSGYENKISEIVAGTDEDITLYAKWELPYNVWRDGTITEVNSLGKTLSEIIIIPEVDGVKVKKIGVLAFRNCTSLVSISIPYGVTVIDNVAFGGCRNLTNVELPESLTSIGNGAFQDCANLTEISIPDSVNAIGPFIFNNCKSLINVKLSSKITRIEQKAFSGCNKLLNVNIPEGVTYIDSNSFSGCVSLKSIDIPGSVGRIGFLAFNGCSSLESVILPEGLTTIEGYLFSDCHSLTAVTIPESVTVIEDRAFLYCRSLKDVHIPENVIEIQENVFGGCNSLANLSVSENNSVYKMVDNCLIDIEAKTLIAGFINSAVPADGSVTEIGSYAFYDIATTEITIPKEITVIGKFAFGDCEDLKNVTFEHTQWSYYTENDPDGIIIPPAYLEDPLQAAKWLAGDRSGYEWRKRG